jgi:hypothetical protein
MQTRAYLTAESDDTARVEVFEGVTMYGGREGKDAVLSETIRLTGDSVDYVMGAEPDGPYAEADSVLTANGWKREGNWVAGDAVTGTYVRVSRA